VRDAVDVLVPLVLSGERVDKAVSLVTGVSRSTAAELLAQGRVRVDGNPVRVRSRPLTEGQRLQVELPPSGTDTPVADPGVRFGVVHEDRWLIVVDKPPGLVVHGGAGNLLGTLVCGLLARYPELAELPRAGTGEAQRPGIVHRLDKGTSGLLVVARTADSYRSLARQFREHSAGREYLALVAGSVEDDAGIVEAPIGRSVRRPDRMAVTSGGKAARTVYRVVARYGEPFDATLVEASLTTGRTHQVRVHLAATGHPVIGDDRYGEAAARPAVLRDAMVPGRLFLHAHKLELEHPGGGRRSWDSALPADLAGVLDRLSVL
jgi:23S rRNA pseudouridine1911/1915/1917 synthase